MTRANAYLLYTQSYDAAGNPLVVTVNWQGPKDGILAISGALMNEANLMIMRDQEPAIGSIVEVGPYRLKIFEYEEGSDMYYLIRQEQDASS